MSFIAIQDAGNNPASPRSIALEKNSGGIKIFSDKYSNVCVQINDFKSDFDVFVIESTGQLIDDEYVSFGVLPKPRLNATSLRCEFNFRLKRSTPRERCFFYIVVSWISSSNAIRFVISCPLASYTRNSVFNQSIDICSYLSMCEIELPPTKAISSNNCFHPQDQINQIMLTWLANTLRSEPHHTFIVHQDEVVTFSNQWLAIQDAARDILMMDSGHNQSLTCNAHGLTSYTCVLLLIQTYVEQADSLITVISDLQSEWPRDEIQLQFSPTLALSIAHQKRAHPV
jgi:hypothetical protein